MMTMGPFLLFYMAMILLPLVLAYSGGLAVRPFRDELASAAGMLAFSIILAEFLLSGRFRQISGGVGLDVTLRLHQIVARSALLLALVHPFLYGLPWADPMVWDADRAESVTVDFASLSGGIVAWLLLPSLVALAIWRDKLDYRYETWRLMHGTGAMVIAGGALQHTLWAGRYAADPWLAGYWIGMAGLAVLSLVYVYVGRPSMQLGRRWRVAEVLPVGPKQWDLRLSPEGHGGLDHAAGQFVWLNVGHSPFTLCENPFSIASAPAQGPDLRFIIKELGDFTSGLGEVEPGTRAYLDGPHGNLTVVGRTEPGIALIAGGVGIAPLLGILRQLRAEGDERPTVLVYGNRIAEQIVHGDELERLSAVVHVLSEPPDGCTGRTGLIDAGLMRELFGAPEYRDWLYVVCGPPGMNTSVEEALSKMGVPSAQVLSERFTYD